MKRNEILTRMKIADMLIAMLDREMEEDDFDPRNPAVKAELERQRAVLVSKLESKEDGDQVQHAQVGSDPSGKPPPQVVGLKALRLNVKRTGLE